MVHKSRLAGGDFTLLLARHPPVSPEFRGRCYGVTDAPLDPDGAPSAAELAASLAEQAWPLGGELPVFHSNLSRTREPAELLAAATGWPLHCAPCLRERHFGAWEGRTWDDIYAETGNAMDGFLDAPDTFAPPGGETTHAMRDRAWRWLAEVCQRQKGRPAAAAIAIAHGGPIAALRGSLEGLPAQEWPRLIPKCAEIVVVSVPLPLR